MHYKRWWRTGSLESTRIVGDDAKRFFSKVRKTDCCWIWTGRKWKGYGKFKTKKDGHCYAHRWSWEHHHKRKIPRGKDLMHTCRTHGAERNNPSCVNPDHLKPATHKENMNDWDFTGDRHPASKVPDIIVKIARRKAAKGWTAKEIAADIRERGFPCSAVTVEYWLKRRHGKYLRRHF